MRVVDLRDPSSSVTAQFVPDAGMIGTSLSDAGVELLGQRRGLDAYCTAGKTMGIPILYPWANRLGANTYTAENVSVTLTPGEGGVRTDPAGLPIHGVLAAYPGWRVLAESANELSAELDFGADPRLLTPPLRHLSLDERGLPSGPTARQPRRSQRLGDSTFDDAYDQVEDGAVFAVGGGDRRLEVHFERGYSAAQIFAPPGEKVVCFEPMAAPTDALRRGGYQCARPGEPALAVFSIHI